MRVEHTPITALYGGRFGRKLLGYQCGHCSGIWTANGSASEPHIQLPPIPGGKRITRKNKAHAARLKATP